MNLWSSLSQSVTHLHGNGQTSARLPRISQAGTRSYSVSMRRRAASRGGRVLARFGETEHVPSSLSMRGASGEEFFGGRFGRSVENEDLENGGGKATPRRGIASDQAPGGIKRAGRTEGNAIRLPNSADAVGCETRIHAIKEPTTSAPRFINRAWCRPRYQEGAGIVVSLCSCVPDQLVLSFAYFGLASKAARPFPDLWFAHCVLKHDINNHQSAPLTAAPCTQERFFLDAPLVALPLRHLTRPHLVCGPRPAHQYSVSASEHFCDRILL